MVNNSWFEEKTLWLMETTSLPYTAVDQDASLPSTTNPSWIALPQITGGLGLIYLLKDITLDKHMYTTN